jgi:hypothetical protein
VPKPKIDPVSGRFIYDNSPRAVKDRADALREWLTDMEPGERRPESARNDIGLGRAHGRQIEAFVDDKSSRPSDHALVPGSTAYEQAFRDRAFQKLARETGIPVDELKR